ncbi:AMP-dependent synthetase/ligase [Macrophomina phaseolina MS6]|uniref:AMP-dependent synthetase/ligase n=1 Tax=Macrophomina phaseolina (strain MS6) TaxID=1126212 RepID=K2SBA5_MACPH|nr:AMP-dependent synthetase/ligase [Macrophomina phaseolina MS6]
MEKDPEPVWRNPSPNAENPMDVYRRHVNQRFTLNLKDSHELQAWTVEKPHDFWIDVHSFLQIIPPLPKGITRAYDDSKPMSDVPPFFEGYKLNYTENILSNRCQDAVALIGITEGESLDGYERLTWSQLSEKVRRTRSALLRHGIRQGDRVAAWMGNHTYTTVLFLAVGAIGAIFTSVSPDMGVEGTLSRFRQITPSLLLVDSHSIYKGKKTATEDKLRAVLDQLQPSLPSVFVNPIVEGTASSFPFLNDLLAKADPRDPLEYIRVPFNHPLVIVYSSGTSGPPKCIIHQQGNILQFKKIAVLHNSLGPDSIVMQYSTTAWVMFYVMNGHMSSGAAAICYEGSPLYPEPTTILDILSRHKYVRQRHPPALPNH